MQTSFIPKKPIVESRPAGSGISLFLLLSIIVFIVSLAMAGGVWVWRNSLIQQIEKDKADLVTLQPKEDEIIPLIRLDDRIKEAQKLLNAHLAITPIFKMLEDNILHNVRISTMKFSYSGPDKIRIDLSGTATSYGSLSSSYGTLSKQADAFGSNSLRKSISEPIITDFSPTIDGRVSFSFTALVDPRLISYDRIVTPATSSVSQTEADVLNAATSTTE